MSSLLNLLRPDRRLALHLPVHGRGAALPPRFRRLLRQSPGSWDLPELPEIGGPLERQGAVATSQARLAEAMGVDQCWYGVNGATGLLQAGLLAMAQPGDAVLLPRNAHRSLISACELGGVMPVFLPVPFISERGHAGAMTAEGLRQSLEPWPDPGRPIAGAVLVHPTYHGYAAEIVELIDLLHSKGLPVMVDEAHGTHLAFASEQDCPISALAAGADLVVHSLHKSAPGLAQTAVVWLRSERLDPERLRRSLGRLQTTSPSALLLASCETTLDWLLSSQWTSWSEARRGEALRLIDDLHRRGVSIHSGDDPFRLILATGQIGWSGLDADDFCMRQGLIAELPEPLCLTLCLGFARHRGLAKRLAFVWQALAREGDGVPLPFIPEPPMQSTSIPELTPDQAQRHPHCMRSLAECADHIAAELICPYPPGVPLLVPGERISVDRCQWLQSQHQRWPDQVPGMVKVLA
ncbi:aminotransferase class I/II-fold pyridoxal phosphate-dependent enzyme [Synechococcus sp. UW179A]|uniref:aminotransferase class I/II-fold pyridoxal phosphate-dependent enzyme n=1 Tax=Synechococcus sp. UW179A TaxID=2575510 RepID=UPI000E0F0ADA|nr:aminotransferase class I/II-fold pyridoxal phosphate-dependent enzyme [Synechococcus sp. UW179A]